ASAAARKLPESNRGRERTNFQLGRGFAARLHGRHRPATSPASNTLIVVKRHSRCPNGWNTKTAQAQPARTGTSAMSETPIAFMVAPTASPTDASSVSMRTLRDWQLPGFHSARIPPLCCSAARSRGAVHHRAEMEFDRARARIRNQDPRSNCCRATYGSVHACIGLRLAAYGPRSTGIYRIHTRVKRMKDEG